MSYIRYLVVAYPYLCNKTKIKKSMFEGYDEYKTGTVQDVMAM